MATTLLMSVGYHYYETTNQSLTLQYFDRDTSPWIFGKQRSVAAASNIAAGGAILLLTEFLPYREIYLLAGLGLGAVAVLLYVLDSDVAAPPGAGPKPAGG